MKSTLNWKLVLIVLVFLGSMAGQNFVDAELPISTSTNKESMFDFNLLPRTPLPCSTFNCVIDSFQSNARVGSLRNIEVDVYKDFGDVALHRLENIYKKIRLNNSNVLIGRFDRESTSFRVSGILPQYLGRHDAIAEIIYTAEPDGFVSISTGIVFTSDGTAAATTQAKDDDFRGQVWGQAIESIDGSSDVIVETASQVERDHKEMIFKHFRTKQVSPNARRQLLSASSGFMSIVAMISGLTKIPDIGFLRESGLDVGVMATQRFRIPRDMYNSIRIDVNRNDISDLDFRSVLHGRQRKDGIVVIGAMTFDSRCSNSICKLASIVIPEHSRLHVTYDPGYISVTALNAITTKRITAGLSNIQLHDRLILRECGLFTEIGILSSIAGMTTTVGIEVQNGRQIHFRGELGQKFPDPFIYGKLVMAGIWDNFMLVPYLHAGNLQLEIQFLPPPTLVIQVLKVGGELWFGRLPQPGQVDNRIKGAVFIGFDLRDPTQNYFYGSLTNLSIQLIVDQFAPQNKSIPLPSILGNTGIYGLPNEDGVLISMSPFVDVTVEDTMPPRTIRRGLNIKGMINILDQIGLMIDIQYDHAMFAFNSTIELHPINILKGLLRIYHQRHDTSKGPSVSWRANLKASLMPSVELKGYISLLGTSGEISTNVSSNGFYFNTTMKLFDVFQSSFQVVWNRPKNFVKVRGEILNFGLFDIIEAGIISILKATFAPFGHRRQLRTMADQHQLYEMYSNGFFSRLRKFGHKLKQKVERKVKKIKKSTKNVKSVIKTHGKHVKATIKNQKIRFKEGSRRIRRGDIGGGLGMMASSALRMAIVVTPLGAFGFHINHMSYDTALESASNIHNFLLRLDISYRLLHQTHYIAFGAAIDFSSPASFYESIAHRLQFEINKGNQ